MGVPYNFIERIIFIRHLSIVINIHIIIVEIRFVKTH